MRSTKVKYRSPYNQFEIEWNNFDVIIKKQKHYKQICEREIRKLIKKGVPVEESKKYLESLIDSWATVLEGEAERIHYKNKKLIQYLVKRREADKLEYKKRLEVIECQLAEKEKEYEQLKDLYMKYNPLKKGRLCLEPERIEEEGDYEDGK